MYYRRKSNENSIVSNTKKDNILNQTEVLNKNDEFNNDSYRINETNDGCVMVKKRKLSVSIDNKNCHSKDGYQKIFDSHHSNAVEDTNYLLGMLRIVNDDFVDSSDSNACRILSKPQEGNFQKNNNIKVISTEGISFSEMSKAHQIVPYEPIENISHTLIGFNYNVANKSLDSYKKLRQTSTKYRDDVHTARLAKRNNKTIIEPVIEDLSLRCLVLAYEFQLFQNDEGKRILKSRTEKDAVRILSILKNLLHTYSKDEIIESMGVTNEMYEEAVEFFKSLSQKP